MTGHPELKNHWEAVYSKKPEQDLSWFQDRPDFSLRIIEETRPPLEKVSLIDVGGGASRLADALLDTGRFEVTVLDLSSAALEAAKSRMGTKAASIDWIVADITEWRPPHQYDMWHDRAALHFLTTQEDQAIYAQTLSLALKPGGVAIIGTFAPEGPEKCSGLPVVRHDASSLAALFGDAYTLIDTRRHDHVTPWGSVQNFQFSTFRKDR